MVQSYVDNKPLMNLRDKDSSPPVQSTASLYMPIVVLTAIFGAVFIFGPLFVRKGEYIGIIRASIMLAAFSMWIFWVTVYISQINPLMGPRLANTTLAWMAHTWGKPAK